MWEVGILGYLIFVVLFFMLFRYCLRISKGLRDPELRIFGIAITLIPVSLIFLNITTAILNVASTSILIWFYLGMIQSIKKIDDDQSEKTSNNREEQTQ